MFERGLLNEKTIKRLEKPFQMKVVSRKKVSNNEIIDENSQPISLTEYSDAVAS
jgi:hypothetical protein